jgi:serine/threonine-protein kinase
MSSPVAPTKIGKYDVVGVIGRGGMGVVYEAIDPHLDRRVAIKMITGAFAENPDMLKRFSREAQSLGSLQHPNIVTVYDLGAHEGNPYLVMEYLEGESLEVAMYSRRQLGFLEKITIVIQVCRGLNYVHRRGVTHRDIKPANIMLGKDGGVKIFDFGIARAGDQNVTRTGELIGTLKYMAPEQVNSNASDFRTDIFSTGVVLYQLLTDHLPFDGDNTASTILRIVHDPPPPLSQFLAVYPPEIEQILLRAMAKNPNDRYNSADDFAFDLENLLGELKEELIGREMREVACSLDRGEVYKAQGSLLRVLKVDHQNSGAIRLLREVQQRIQRYEIGKQVEGLQEQAEKALADGRFEDAREHVDRALALGLDDAGLKQHCETIRAEAMRSERLYNALNIAQAAQADGNLDVARKAAEEALAMAPDNPRARTLVRLISRELEERSRQQQMEACLREARQEISSRRFTGALEILKRAEELDPTAPQVHSLIDSAVAGQERERHRRELDALMREIEDALNRDDYRSACEKADEGLARFPDEPNLLKLKALADRQRQLEDRKHFVDEQLVKARQMLQAGCNQELQVELENVISQIGPEPRLLSLLAIVAENLRRQRTEQRYDRQQKNNSQEIHDATAPLELDTGVSREFGPCQVQNEAIQPAVGSDRLTGDKLQIIERQLAALIGPLAKVLVKRRAAKTTSTLELYSALAADLEREEDRNAFLAKRAELALGHDSGPPSKQVLPETARVSAPPLAASAAEEITPAAIERAARALVAHLGPIAAVLAKKEAKRASTVRNLYELLAEHIVDSAEREGFLKSAVAQKEIP